MYTQAQAASRTANAHSFNKGDVVYNHGFTNTVELTEAALRQAAPSIFTESAHEGVSDKYLFMPTYEILQAIKKKTGLVPVKVVEQRVREEGNSPFAKHQIVLRSPAPMTEWKVGDLMFEARLTNSHNRSCAYALDPGLFRFACNNGLMVPESVLPGVRVKHVGSDEVLHDIIDGCTRVLTEAPQLQHTVENLKALQLTTGEAKVFADAAALLRWDEGKQVVHGEQLLQARRMEDVGSDTWRVMNRVQENLIKGGVHDRKAGGNGRIRNVTSRGVESIAENQRINKALFQLAEGMAKLKAAA